MTDENQDPIKVYNGSDELFFPKVSPDGNMIAFGKFFGNDYSVTVFDLNSFEEKIVYQLDIGYNPNILNEGSSDFRDPPKYGWSPDGKFLAVYFFTNNPKDLDKTIYRNNFLIINLITEEIEFLNFSDSGGIVETADPPVWADNGINILFPTKFSDIIYDVELKTFTSDFNSGWNYISSHDKHWFYIDGKTKPYVLNSLEFDGSNHKTYETEGFLSRIFDFCISNNERNILYTGTEESNSIGLFTLNIDSHNLITISPKDYFKNSAAWSPDCKWVAANEGIIESRSRVVLYNIDNEESFPITDYKSMFLIDWVTD